jgi:hypothetical protein
LHLISALFGKRDGGDVSVCPRQRDSSPRTQEVGVNGVIQKDSAALDFSEDIDHTIFQGKAYSPSCAAFSSRTVKVAIASHIKGIVSNGLSIHRLHRAFPGIVSQTRTPQNVNGAAPVVGGIFTTETRLYFHP